ncbi:MAG: ArsB/NhaD family transporter [Selenomonadaceae bacterium]
MAANASLAIFIFIVAYALIVSEKVHRTVVALGAAMILIFAGILSQSEAIHHIDFNTLGLLIGMMVVVNITSETGLFNYLAIWSAKKVKADPLWLLVALSALTAICSAFLDNVTTVLLTVPVTFSITAQLKVNPKPFLVAQILAANIGGTATLIGDPPNIMLGSAVKELDFMAFLTNLSLISILIFIVTMALLVIIYRKELHTTEELKDKVMRLKEKNQISNVKLLKKCLFVLAVTITLFMFHSVLQLETASAALAGASLLMLMTAANDEALLAKVFGKVEWLAIFFFAGLFILVGGLVETGVIKMLAVEAMKATQGNLTATTMLVLWLSAIASAFVDNIPFVATMIPLIKDLGELGMPNIMPLWWALSLGACLGGNGTLIGASANVVVSGMAAQHGCQMSFVKYMKVAFPLMLLSIAISSVYLYIFYLR